MRIKGQETRLILQEHDDDDDDDIYSDTFRIAKEAPNALRSTGKATVLGIWTFLLVMTVQDATIYHCEKC